MQKWKLPEHLGGRTYDGIRDVVRGEQVVWFDICGRQSFISLAELTEVHDFAFNQIVLDKNGRVFQRIGGTERWERVGYADAFSTEDMLHHGPLMKLNT